MIYYPTLYFGVKHLIIAINFTHYYADTKLNQHELYCMLQQRYTRPSTEAPMCPMKQICTLFWFKCLLSLLSKMCVLKLKVLIFLQRCHCVEH